MSYLCRPACSPGVSRLKVSSSSPLEMRQQKNLALSLIYISHASQWDFGPGDRKGKSGQQLNCTSVPQVSLTALKIIRGWIGIGPDTSSSYRGGRCVRKTHSLSNLFGHRPTINVFYGQMGRVSDPFRRFYLSDVPCLPRLTIGGHRIEGGFSVNDEVARVLIPL